MNQRKRSSWEKNRTNMCQSLVICIKKHFLVKKICLVVHICMLRKKYKMSKPSRLQLSPFPIENQLHGQRLSCVVSFFFCYCSKKNRETIWKPEFRRKLFFLHYLPQLKIFVSMLLCPYVLMLLVEQHKRKKKFPTCTQQRWKRRALFLFLTPAYNFSNEKWKWVCFFFLLIIITTTVPCSSTFPIQHILLLSFRSRESPRMKMKSFLQTWTKFFFCFQLFSCNTYTPHTRVIDEIREPTRVWELPWFSAISWIGSSFSFSSSLVPFFSLPRLHTLIISPSSNYSFRIKSVHKYISTQW